jgi:hypothetical protein
VAWFHRVFLKVSTDSVSRDHNARSKLNVRDFLTIHENSNPTGTEAQNLGSFLNGYCERKIVTIRLAALERRAI